MPKTITAEVWVAVNSGGDAQVSIDDDGDGALDGLPGAVRLVKVMLTVPVPEPVIVAATVADEPSNVTVAVS